jgi:hypothetical protein
MRQNKITEALKMLSKPELQEIKYHKVSSGLSELLYLS